MASTITNPLPELIKAVPLVLTLFISTILNSQPAFSVNLGGGNGHEHHVADELPRLYNWTSSLRSAFLLPRLRRGMRCGVTSRNICPGVWTNNGTSLLFCCRKHCRDVLGDSNNCGECGHRCRFGQHCCDGVCTDVVFNADHCGRCRNKCPHSVKCDFGHCGYA